MKYEVFSTATCEKDGTFTMAFGVKDNDYIPDTSKMICWKCKQPFKSITLTHKEINE
jgi:hypothetical protein